LLLLDALTELSEEILNRQTFKALPACELINLTSLVGWLYAGKASYIREVLLMSDVSILA